MTSYLNHTHCLRLTPLLYAYFDELEIRNPLGTHTKVHKLGIVLFMLGIFVLCSTCHPLIIKSYVLL